MPTLDVQRLAATLDELARRGQAAEAERLCRTATADHPGEAAAWQMLGVTLVRAGRVAEAIDPLRRATTLAPAAPAAWMSLGMAMVGVDPDGAIDALGRASALRAGWPEADVQLGHLLLDASRAAEAATAYRRVLSTRPEWPAALVGLGNALYAQRQLPAALDCYRRAAAVDPRDTNAALNGGNVLAALGRRPEAIAAFRQCLAVRPDDPRATVNLGTALYLDGQLDEAEAIFRHHLARVPDDRDPLVNLAGLLKDKGRLDEAIAIGRRAVAADPTSTAAHSNLIYTMSFHSDVPPADVLAKARRYDAAHGTVPTKPLANDRSPDRRLRIGYVSPDLRHHAVGQFLLPLVEHHDPAAVEVTLYGLGVAEDDLTDRLRRAAHRYRDLGGLSDDQAADVVRGDGIDVLVDLALHMGHNRLPIFARRPAPVQVTYLAYAGTSGLSAMDYRLSDPYLDPPGADQPYSERTERLSATYWCYRPAYDLPLDPMLPVERTGVVTFGSLNNFCKVNGPVLAAWAEVLSRVPESRLMLHAQDGDHRQAVARAMAERGVSTNRLAFVGLVPTRQYLSLYSQVDVGLDPFPYNGGTTTLDALWMGVPVVSLATDRAVGRAGRSILTNAGLPELAVDTVADYVRVAVELATDRPRLAELRRTLRDRLSSSVLMDGPSLNGTGNGSGAGRRQLAALGLGRARGGRLFPLDLADLDQPGGLADAVPQVEQLGPAGLAAPLDGHLADVRAVQREDAFHALVVHDPADGEHLVDAPPLLHDDGAAERLDALLVALDDPGGDVDRVAHEELRDVLLEVVLFDGFDEFVDHGVLRVVSASPENTSRPPRLD